MHGNRVMIGKYLPTNSAVFRKIHLRRSFNSNSCINMAYDIPDDDESGLCKCKNVGKIQKDCMLPGLPTGL